MKKGGKEKPPSLAESRPDAFVKGQARRYVRDVGNAKMAYDAHRGLKVLVRYEDLRADTLQTMKRIYSALEMHVEESELARSVEKHSWENIPEEEKGEGKFHRKAKPGGWREDLTRKAGRDSRRGGRPPPQRALPRPEHRVGGSWCPSSDIRKVFGVVRRIRAVLGLEAGVTRGALVEPDRHRRALRRRCRSREHDLDLRHGTHREHLARRDDGGARRS